MDLEVAIFYVLFGLQRWYYITCKAPNEAVNTEYHNHSIQFCQFVRINMSNSPAYLPHENVLLWAFLNARTSAHTHTCMENYTRAQTDTHAHD